MVEKLRYICAQVPHPSELLGAKNMPDLGNILPDALIMRELALTQEQTFFHKPLSDQDVAHTRRT